MKTTIKFTANDADLEAHMGLSLLEDGDFIVHCYDITCGGDSLDREEVSHLFSTNPLLIVQLAEMVISESTNVSSH